MPGALNTNQVPGVSLPARLPALPLTSTSPLSAKPAGGGARGRIAAEGVACGSCRSSADQGLVPQGWSWRPLDYGGGAQTWELEDRQPFSGAPGSAVLNPCLNY